MDHAPTEEQRTIIDRVRGDENLVVEALAGSGKSYTVLQALKVIPQRSILLAAFNRPICDDLAARVQVLRLPKTHVVHVQTFHAAGLKILKRHFPKLEVDRNAHELLVNHVAGKGISFKMRRAALKLIRTIKDTYAKEIPPTSEHTLAVGYEHGIFSSKMSEREIGLTVEAVRDAYIVSLGMDRRETIDFSDMVWAPVALKLAPPSRYKAIIVDEFQDISDPQFELLMMLMAPGSRFIGVGDRQQQIYQFRGSLGARAWDLARETLKAETLPLTMTFRCSKAVVRSANRIVPQLRPMDDAPEGSESSCKLGELPFKLANSRSDEIHTFILSRTNADLVDAALYLWQNRVSFQLNTGQELLEPIFDLLKNKLDTRDETQFRRSLDEWFGEESKKAEKANATAYAEKIEDQRRMLLAALKYAKPYRIAGLLGEILQPNQSGILCSTVHKVKGLEAERVFLLKQTFASYVERVRRFVFEDQIEWMTIVGTTVPEELHLEYVAITRAKEHLIWVDIAAPDARETPATEAFILNTDLSTMTQEQLLERLMRVENMATRTKDVELSTAFMHHARQIEKLLQ